MNDSAAPARRADRPLCVAVDWGTSRLRAHLVAADGRRLESIAADEGMARVVAGGFEAVLTKNCATWLRDHPGLPVFMAGMVGSRNGWREAPYVACPGGLDAIAQGMIAFEISGGVRIHIVPGMVRDDGVADVMRGEETQILGVGVDDAVVVLPGTHSKWAVLRAGRIETFRTYMTGEVFGLLTRHSVLRLLAEPSDDPAAERAAFRAGLAAASAAGGLLAGAFHARAGVLTGRLHPAAVEPYLSGLLIGAEIAEAARTAPADLPIVLVADGVIAANYREAIEATGRTVAVVDPERAFVDGLIRVARRREEGNDDGLR